MGERAYKATSSFKIVIYLSMLGSMISFCFHTMLWTNNDLRGAGLFQMLERQGSRIYHGANFELYVGIGALILAIIMVFLLGILISICVLMIISSSETRKGQADRLIGGVMVGYSILFGILGILFIQRGLMFGGFSLFINKQLPERFRKKNLQAFLLVTAGGIFPYIGWALFILTRPNGIAYILGILSSILTIWGLITYLIILNKDEELPLPTERRRPRRRYRSGRRNHRRAPISPGRRSPGIRFLQHINIT